MVQGDGHADPVAVPEEQFRACDALLDCGKKVMGGLLRQLQMYSHAVITGECTAAVVQLLLLMLQHAEHCNAQELLQQFLQVSSVSPCLQPPWSRLCMGLQILRRVVLGIGPLCTTIRVHSNGFFFNSFWHAGLLHGCLSSFPRAFFKRHQLLHCTAYSSLLLFPVP